MVAEARYTDRDVRESGVLRIFAERYAFSYSGDFQPLLDAQHMYMSEGRLTTPVARMVLNCARNDARYANQLNEIEREKPNLHLVRDIQQTILNGYPRKVTRRPSVIELPFKFNFQYGMSAHKQAFKIHVPDPDRSSMRFFPGTWEGRLTLYWMCGVRASDQVDIEMWNEKPNAFLLNLEECDKCMRNSAQRKFDSS